MAVQTPSPEEAWKEVEKTLSRNEHYVVDLPQNVPGYRHRTMREDIARLVKKWAHPTRSSKSTGE